MIEEHWNFFSHKKMKYKMAIINCIKSDIDAAFMKITPLLLDLCKNYIEFKNSEKYLDYKFYCHFYRNDNRIKSKIHRILFEIRNRYQKTNLYLSDRITKALPFTNFRHLPKDASLPEISKPPKCTSELVHLIFDKYW